MLLVLLAVYVSVGRLVLANLHTYREPLLQELNLRLPFDVDAQELHGEWNPFAPTIAFTELRLAFPDADIAPLELAKGRVAVDVFNSLRTRSLQLARLSIQDLTLRGALSPQGKFSLTGFEFGRAGGSSGVWLREMLRNLRAVTLKNNTLRLTMPNGEERSLDLDLQLKRSGSRRWMNADLTSTEGTSISLSATGLGNPFTPQYFTGDLFVNIDAVDFGAVQALLASGAPPLWPQGALDMQWWLSWDRGEPKVSASFQGRELTLSSADADWHIPIQSMSVRAQVQRDAEHWSLFASDFVVEQEAATLVLPRLQLDAWGNRVRARIPSLSLEDVSASLTALHALPPKWCELFATLAMNGELSALQLEVADMRQPTARWAAATEFENVRVDSFKGVPGLYSLDGYARFSEGGGYVALDSDDVALSFPTVFEKPLQYAEVFGRLDVAWGGDTVALHSGLLTARAPEGEAKALFALDIPKRPTEQGVSMELLVGLEDTATSVKDKYLPYILDANLLDWLHRSIGEGVIDQGAFLWRGSLQKGAAEHRTVQLAFNVADTYLDYHPRWPAVTLDEGVVHIDDTAVTVWADRARLYDSRVRNVSVQTWVDAKQDLLLAVHGDIAGTAADGLRVLNESALNEVVDSTFNQWRAEGSLQAELDLLINLKDKRVKPDVAVTAQLQDVDLHIVPGNITLDSAEGTFSFSSRTGFSSESLRAQLWGEAVDVAIEQTHAGRGEYVPKQTQIAINARTRVALQDLWAWLPVDGSQYATGRTAASLSVQLPPGGPPQLLISSQLEGVQLELPSPWHKAPGEKRNLRIAMPFGKDAGPLRASLGSDLELALALGDGNLQGASLGVNAMPATVELGKVRIEGSTPIVHSDEWLSVVQSVMGQEDTAQTKEWVGASSAESAASNSTASSAAVPSTLNITMEQFRIGSLLYGERDLGEVVLGMAIAKGQCEVRVQAPFLRGTVTMGDNSDVVGLHVEQLDIDGLSRAFAAPVIESAGDSTNRTAGDSLDLELPTLAVDIANLTRGEERLGNLSFELVTGAQRITAENIVGTLIDLQFGEDEPARLSWVRGPTSATDFSGTVEFEDLGKTLGHLGYQRILQTKQGRFDMKLRWPGSPTDFSMATGQGSIEVAIGAGSFLEAPAAASGALRVVSILNLVDIVRRLSLTHMFESGIPFDSVDGEVYLHDGTVEVSRLDFAGGSRFQFTGVSDVATKRVAAELVATLPVASNLPWIAALAVSPPVAAGVFVASKIFDKQVNKLSSAVYGIEGTWDNPEVGFKRIFDDKSQGVSKLAQSKGMTEGAKTAQSSADDSEEDAAVPPAVIDTQAAEPKVSEPKVSEPKVSEPKVSEPKVFEPRPESIGAELKTESGG